VCVSKSLAPIFLNNVVSQSHTHSSKIPLRGFSSNSPKNLIFTKTQIGGSRVEMARHTAALKIGLALLGLSMAGYILGPPLYWHLTEALAAVSASSCPSCPCECSTYSAVTIPKGKQKLA